jgi:hypothetical protein
MYRRSLIILSATSFNDHYKDGLMRKDFPFFYLLSSSICTSFNYFMIKKMLQKTFGHHAQVLLKPATTKGFMI